MGRRFKFCRISEILKELFQLFLIFQTVSVFICDQFIGYSPKLLEDPLDSSAIRLVDGPPKVVLAVNRVNDVEVFQSEVRKTLLWLTIIRSRSQLLVSLFHVFKL